MKKFLQIVSLLALKSSKMMFRRKSNISLAVMSSLIVCGSLYIMWLYSIGQTVGFMSSSAYSKLSFDLNCQPSVDTSVSMQCTPMNTLSDNSMTDLSTTEFILSTLQDGGSVTSDSQETTEFAGLLSSLLMNGLPLLGLDDYVYLSDFVNDNIGKQSKEKLMTFPGYKDKFGNLINVRANTLRFSPKSYWADQFIHYLRNTSQTFAELHVETFDSLQEAMEDCCDNVWAVVDLASYIPTGKSLYTDIMKSLNYSDDGNLDGNGNTILSQPLPAEVRNNGSNTIPAVTIRMHPASIPDTRNFEWSPIDRAAPTRQQSGQLLYFISGFLSIQVELQNFLTLHERKLGRGGDARVIETDVFKKQTQSLLQPVNAARSVAKALFGAHNRSDVYHSIMNTTSAPASSFVRPTLFFPLYYRAFPTHNYHQSMYWHVYGTLVTISLIIYFSLPAALVAGAFHKEKSRGILELLSTFPGIKQFHSMIAWCVCGGYGVFTFFLVTVLYFLLVLDKSNALVPAVCLLLFGCALGPFAMALGEIIQNADAVVVAVPSIVFVTLLPGLLYFDLAFDIQRSFVTEMLLSLLPASAVALALRLIFAAESTFVDATWYYKSPVSHTPVYAYAVMLVFDLWLYGYIAYFLVNRYGYNAIYKQQEAEEKKKKAVAAAAEAESRSELRESPSLDSDDFQQHSYQYSSFNTTSRNESPRRVSRNASWSFRGCVYWLFACCGNCWYAIVLLFQESNHRYGEVTPDDSTDDLPARAATPKPVVNAAVPGLGLFERFFSRGSTPVDDIESNRKAPDVALDIQQVTKQRPTNDLSVVVLASITTVLKKNCVTLLLGSNGAGKTTLMKILSGIDADFTGSVTFIPNMNQRDKSERSSRHVFGFGKSISKEQRKSLGTGSETKKPPKKPMNKRAIGWCPQNDALFDLLSVQEHLELFTQLMNTSLPATSEVMTAKEYQTSILRKTISSIEKALEKLNMTEHAAKLVKELSGGMKRRLSLSLAFIGNPSVLLLDEPTSGCDAFTRELVRKDILSHKNPFCAVLISTHHTDDIEVLGDHIWFLNDRYLEYDDSIDNLSYSSTSKLRRKRSMSQSYVDFNNCEELTHGRPQKTNILDNLRDIVTEDDGIKVESFQSHLTSNLEFTTWDEDVRSKFTAHVGKLLLDSWFDVNSSRCNVELMDGRNRLISPSTTPAGRASSIDASGMSEVLPNQQTNIYVWIIEPDKHDLLYSFIQVLERENNLNWSLNTSYAYKALTHLYDKPANTLGSASGEMSTRHSREALPMLSTPPKQSRKFFTDSPESCPDTSKTPGGDTVITVTPLSDQSRLQLWLSKLNNFSWHMHSITWLRMLELRSSCSVFAITQLLIPFFVVLAVTCSCRDVTYPKVELTSSSMRDIGEVPISQGYTREAEPDGTSLKRLLMKKDKTSENKNETLMFQEMMRNLDNKNYSNGGAQLDLSWQGLINSDQMYTRLYNDYYKHSEQRWGALIIQDTVPQWIESTIVIDQAALHIDIHDAYAEIQAAQQAICNATHHANSTTVTNSTGTTNSTSSTNSTNINNGTSIGNYTTVIDDDNSTDISLPDSVSRQLKTHHHKDQGGVKVSKPVPICGGFPSITVAMRNDSTLRNDSSDAMVTTYSIAITSFESLQSNLTMLTNVTTDHAAPIFLKQVIPLVYGALGGTTDADEATPQRRHLTSAESSGIEKPDLMSGYVLFSHPLPEINYTNVVYIQRGLLGSTIIVLFMLLLTMSVVRFVTKTKANGIKNQLQLSGIHPATYWLGNYLFDTMLIFCTLLTVYLAVFLGGDPIRNYFFAFPPGPGVLFLYCVMCFACAVTSCNYACTVLSRNQQSSQLFILISSVVTGGFFKLYLDRNHTFPNPQLAHIMVNVSPSFAFSTALFNMFRIYTIAVGKQLTGVDHDELSASLLTDSVVCCYTMLVQAVVYLIVCILIDMNYTRVMSMLGRWRWYYSAVRVEDTLYNKVKAINGLISTSINRTRDNSRVHDDEDDSPRNSFSTPMVETSSLLRSSSAASPNYSDSTHNTFVSVDLFDSRNSLNRLVDHSPVPARKASRSDEIGIFPSFEEDLYQNALEMNNLKRKRVQPLSNLPAGGRSASKVLFSDYVNEVHIDSPMERSDISRLADDDVTYEENRLYALNRSVERGRRQAGGGKTAVDSRGLSVEYSKKRQLALCNLTFQMPVDGKVALMGMNGGGKSTLFKTLNLAQNIPISGEVSVHGRDVVTSAASIGSENLMGYVPQEGGLMEFLTVGECIELFTMIKMHRHATREDECEDDLNAQQTSVGRTKDRKTRRRGNSFASIDLSLNSSGIIAPPTPDTPRDDDGKVIDGAPDHSIVPAKYLSYPIFALSGGTKKKLSLKIANINRPALLMLDECTTGVDPIAADRIMRYLKDKFNSKSSSGSVARPQALLFSSHRIDESLALCDRVLMLVEGQTFLDGSMEVFNTIAHQFYQVDVVVNLDFNIHSDALTSVLGNTYIPLDISMVDYFMMHVTKVCDDHVTQVVKDGDDIRKSSDQKSVERLVVYSDTLARITFEKTLIPISMMWSHLIEWREAGLLVKYSFRNMDLEEVLSTIIASSTKKQ